MKPVNQTIFTNLQTGEIGNCFEACLASLLELPLEAVPRFERLKYTRRAAQRFAKKNGYRLKRHFGLPPSSFRDYVIGCFWTPFSDKIVHCVIWRNGKVIHDPRGKKKIPLVKMAGYYTLTRLKL